MRVHKQQIEEIKEYAHTHTHVEIPIEMTSAVPASIMLQTVLQSSSKIQRELFGLNQSSGYLESLPDSVHNQLEKLERLHFLKSRLEEYWDQQCRKLEFSTKNDAADSSSRYAQAKQELFKKRMEVIIGNNSSSSGNCDDVVSSGQDEEEKKLNSPLELQQQPSKLAVPFFWLTALHNAPEELSQLISDEDAKVLEYLINISIEYDEDLSQVDASSGIQQLSRYHIHFDFHPHNPFFENPRLTKTFYMKEKVVEGGLEGFVRMIREIDATCCSENSENVETHDESIPATNTATIQEMNLSDDSDASDSDYVEEDTEQEEDQQQVEEEAFYAPEIYKSSSTSISWLMKEFDKSSQGFIRFFFCENFSNEDEESERLLAQQFAIGELFREHLVPDAYIWFTGEAVADYYDDEDEEDEDQDQDDKPAQECQQQ